jgi:hypothetical protein
MLIPLGIWAASGAGSGAAAGAYELISTVNPTGVTTVTFSSIPQTYKHLQVRLTSRNSNTTTYNMEARLTMNGVGGTSYSYHRMYGQGSSVTSSAQTALPWIRMPYQSASFASAGASVFGATIIDILDYTSTTKNKTVRALGGLAGVVATDNQRVDLVSGALYSTSAVTSLSYFWETSDNFSTGSRVSLYGIKG